jgi:hypothetical protein
MFALFTDLIAGEAMPQAEYLGRQARLVNYLSQKPGTPAGPPGQGQLAPGTAGAGTGPASPRGPEAGAVPVRHAGLVKQIKPKRAASGPTPAGHGAPVPIPRPVGLLHGPGGILYSRQRWDGGSRRLSMLLPPGPRAATPGKAPAKPPASGANRRHRCGRHRSRRGGMGSLCAPGRIRPQPGPAARAACRVVITPTAGRLRPALGSLAYKPQPARQGTRRAPFPLTCRMTLLPPARAAAGTNGSASRPGRPAAARPPQLSSGASLPPDRSGLTAGADERHGSVCPARTGGWTHA